MQENLRRKLLAVISSNMMTEWETKAFPDMYKRDVYAPRSVTPKVAAYINKAHARIFEGRDNSKEPLFPSELGAFKIVRKGADYYLEINGVPIPEPISKAWGCELVQYLHQAHRCGALTRSVLSLVKSESTQKVDTDEDPF